MHPYPSRGLGQSAVPLLTAAVLLSGCTDRHEPTGPEGIPSRLESAAAVSPDFTRFRTVAVLADPALSHRALQSLWPLSATQVLITRADDRFFVVDVAGTGSIISQFADPSPTTPAENYGSWGTGEEAWAGDDDGNVVRFSGGGWSVVSGNNSSGFQALGMGGIDATRVRAAGGDRGGDGNAYLWNISGSIVSNESVPGNAGALWGTCGEWAVGNGGTLLRLEDGKWNRHTSPTAADLRDIDCYSASEVWAVGASGIAIRWDGSAWSVVAGPAGAPDLYGVQVLSAGVVYAAGHGGLYRWGGSWTLVGDPALEGLNFRDVRIWRGAPGTDPVLFGATAEGQIVVGTTEARITVTSSGGDCSGTITVTDVVSGEYQVGQMSSESVPACTVEFPVKSGASVLVHRRSFLVSSIDDLRVWPLPNTETQNVTPAILNAPAGLVYPVAGGQALLTPQSYMAAAGDPLVVEGHTRVHFDLATGSTVRCTLVNTDGTTVAGSGEGMYLITPFGSLRGLPAYSDPNHPNYSRFNPNGLPVGIALAAGRVSGSGTCELNGATTGTHVTEGKVEGAAFVSTAQVETLTSGADISLLREYAYEAIGYLSDPLDDSHGTVELGAGGTYGWIAGTNGSEIATSAEFRVPDGGNARIALFIESLDAAGALLSSTSYATTCTATSGIYKCVSSDPPGRNVVVTGYGRVIDGVGTGKVVIKVGDLGAAAKVRFQLRAATMTKDSSDWGDYMPNPSATHDGYQTAEKSGGGNSFAIAG